MKKIYYSILLILLFSYTHSIYATSTPSISWKLGSEDYLIDLIKKMGFSAGKNAVGIHNLINYIDIDIHANKVKKRVRRAFYYSDTSSLQNYGTDTIPYNKLSESVIIYQAGVIQKKGDFISFNPSNSQVLDTDTYDLFSNTVEIVIPFSGIEVGAVAILDYEIISNKKLKEADWSQVFYPQTSTPVKNYKLRVNWFDGIKAQWNSSSKFIDCQHQDFSLICLGDNIPGVVSDHDVQWSDELGQVVIGELYSWNEVITNAIEKFKLSFNNTTGIKDIIESITKTNDSLEQKISNIHKFVAREIRYTSFSGEGHSITPHSVKETLLNRYGDCKDKSALLVELLKQVSVQAYPVLIATNRKSVENLKIPAMNYFDHMVVCFTHLSNEKCLDATDTQTDWQSTPRWIQGKVALRLLLDETPTTIKQDKFLWNLAIKNKVKFTDEGGLEESQNRVYKANYASWYRQSLVAKNLQERKQWMSDQYKNQISSTAEPIFTLSGVDQIKPELIIKSNTKYPSFLDIKTDLAYLDSDAWVSYEINSLILKNKQYNSFSPGLKMISEYEFDTQVHWKVNYSSPELNLKHKYGSMTRTVREKDNKTIISTTIKIPSRNVPASEVITFNKFLKLIKRESTLSIHGTKL